MDTPGLYVSIPLRSHPVRATESRLERIYRAAYNGLKGDSLALAAGLTPQEFNALQQMDQQVEMAVLKGRADSEMEHSALLADASRRGDAKASLAILQHVHGWTAKQSIDVTTHSEVDIKTLLQERASRLYEGEVERID